MELNRSNLSSRCYCFHFTAQALTLRPHPLTCRSVMPIYLPPYPLSLETVNCSAG